MSNLLHHRLFPSFHPFYRAVLTRADGQGYDKPTWATMIRQNKMVVDLVGAGVWAKLEFLHNGMHDAASLDFMRINWPRPLWDLATGSPSWSSKQGIGNLGAALDLKFNITTAGGDCILGTQSNNITVGAFSRVGGSNTGGLLVGGSDGSFTYQIRSANNPRTDCGLCEGIASPRVMQSGVTQSNTLYTATKRPNGGNCDYTTYVGGTPTVVGTNISPGAVPSADSVMASGLASGRYVGLVFGGLGLTTVEIAAINTIIQDYISNL